MLLCSTGSHSVWVSTCADHYLLISTCRSMSYHIYAVHAPAYTPFLPTHFDLTTITSLTSHGF